MNDHTEHTKSLLERLSELYPDSSRSTLRQWISKGRVQLDGRVVTRADTPVLPGQKIERGEKVATQPEGLQIVFADKDLVVIDKPYGLLSVALDEDTTISAHSILKEHLNPSRVYVVHRLDKDTSGLLIFALNPRALEHLKEQLKTHSVQRTYYAVVEGSPSSDEGTWDSYLTEGKDLVVRTTRDPSKGQRAITHYSVEGRGPRRSLLRISLETGRKNQIRAHCQAAQCCVVGDKKYGAEDRFAPRLCLHATRLEFIHPRTGETLCFDSPMPGAFKNVLHQK
ncbi:MAG: RluA family pseudouridine synthase [Chlamydiia bacterium]|nr:RluA family pseudouridine synthase [Chlamydiia bacterium]